ncbi:hypothetical protein STEG23_009370 [Scotinomys teguina]
MHSLPMLPQRLRDAERVANKPSVFKLMVEADQVVTMAACAKLKQEDYPGSKLLLLCDIAGFCGSDGTQFKASVGYRANSRTDIKGYT